jgi:hypothetical protein
MRLFLATLVHWVITAGLILGAIAFFSMPANASWSAVQIESVAAAIVFGAMIIASAIALQENVRWVILLFGAICLSLGLCAFYQIQETIDFGPDLMSALTTYVLVLALWFMIFNVVSRTYRLMTILTFWLNPEEIHKCVADLDSPNLSKKRFAVQTLSDYLGRGFAGAESWPFSRSGREELELHAAVIKRIWDAKQAAVAECPSEQWLLGQLGKKMKEGFGQLSRRPPTVHPDPKPFESSTLTSQAGSIPQSLPALESWRLVEDMQPRIAETLGEAARIINEAQAGSLIVDCEEPVGELLAQLFLEAYQVALSLRLESLKIKLPGSFVEAPVWKLSDGGFLTVVPLIEGAADFLKDALMDLNLLAEEVRVEPAPEDLPCMASDEYLLHMLPHVESVLEQFVEITNQSPNGLILVDEEPGLCRLFAKLHAQSLETGLELRVRRAEALGLARPSKAPAADSPFATIRGRWEKKHIQTPSLRKAASPPLPPSMLGWAQKYRHMRIAGTRFPLLRKDQDQSLELDSSPTSIKPSLS